MSFTGGSDPRNEQRKAHRNQGETPVRIKGMVVLAVTDKAILVCESLEVGGENPMKVWVPRSKMTMCEPSLSSVERTDTIDFTVPRWLAEAKELFWE